MRATTSISLAYALLLLAMGAQSQTRAPLRLIQTITIPNVNGRLDHLDADITGRRLFVAALENGSVEVLDLRSGKWVRSIAGFAKPQGPWYVAQLNTLFVASGDDGMVRAFRGDTLDLLTSIKLDLGPNRVAYDPHTNNLYVGYGGKDAGKDYGEIGVINAKTFRHVGDIRVAAHPAEVLLDSTGETIFTAIAGADQIQVIDVKNREVQANWPTPSKRPADMALDNKRHRLFVGTHTPPEVVVFDSQSGRKVCSVVTVEGLDGVYFDAALNRVYVSGGRGLAYGFVYVYQERDDDHFDLIGKVPSRAGAGTSLWVPQLNRYYVAAPSHNNESAAILVFEPQP